MTSGSSPVAALIDRYDAAWNAQDLDAIASMHDDAIVFHNHTAGERVAGAAGLVVGRRLLLRILELTRVEALAVLEIGLVLLGAARSQDGRRRQGQHDHSHLLRDHERAEQ